MRVVCRLSIPQAAWMLPRVWSRRGAPQTGAPISRDADTKERSMGRRAPQEAAGTPAFLASLGSPDYRRLWSATACSQAAVWALVVLRGALVYEVTTSNAWVGVVAMAAQLPSLVVTPFAGLLADRCERRHLLDRKSTRLNSSHGYISYAVFCLKKKKNRKHNATLHK